MKAFFTFKKLAAPVLIQIIYWAGTIAVILGAVSIIISSNISYLRTRSVLGFLLLFLGPIVMRLWAEYMTAFFDIRRNLNDLRDVAVREAYEKYEADLEK